MVRRVFYNFGVNNFDANPVRVYYEKDLSIICGSDYDALGIVLKMEANVLLYCRRGNASFRVNGKMIDVNAQQIMVIPSSSVVEDIQMDPGFSYWMFIINDRLLKQLLHSHLEVWNRLFYIQKVLLINIDGDWQELLQQSADLMTRILSSDGQPFLEDVVHCQVESVVLWICGRMNMENRRVYDSSEASMLIFNSFVDILSKEEQKRHPVKYYSDKLNISPKYLAAVCKQQSGKTASQWITDSVNNEIVYMLRSSDHNMKNIAYQCGFPNPSAFGKYVRENFGVSPKEYRAVLRNKGEK